MCHQKSAFCSRWITELPAHSGIFGTSCIHLLLQQSNCKSALSTTKSEQFLLRLVIFFRYKDKKSSKEEQEAVCEKKEKEKEKEKEPPAKPKKECVKFSTNPAEGANSTNSPLTNSAKPKGNWNFVRKFRRAIMPSKTRNKRKAALAC